VACAPADRSERGAKRARRAQRRLRVSLAINQLSYGFGPEAAQRRIRIRAAMGEQPDLGAVRHTNMLGPWDIPDDAFTEATYAAIAAC
jgi:hypothetical protein